MLSYKGDDGWLLQRQCQATRETMLRFQGNNAKLQRKQCLASREMMLSYKGDLGKLLGEIMALKSPPAGCRWAAALCGGSGATGQQHTGLLEDDLGTRGGRSGDDHQPGGERTGKEQPFPVCPAPKPQRLSSNLKCFCGFLVWPLP